MWIRNPMVISVDVEKVRLLSLPDSKDKNKQNETKPPQIWCRRNVPQNYADCI